jgi:hypothetical protein
MIIEVHTRFANKLLSHCWHEKVDDQKYGERTSSSDEDSLTNSGS